MPKDEKGKAFPASEHTNPPHTTCNVACSWCQPKPLTVIQQGCDDVNMAVVDRTWRLEQL
eukprot:1765102-Rhodomonas_salina.1